MNPDSELSKQNEHSRMPIRSAIARYDQSMVGIFKIELEKILSDLEKGEPAIAKTRIQTMLEKDYGQIADSTHPHQCLGQNPDRKRHDDIVRQRSAV